MSESSRNSHRIPVEGPGEGGADPAPPSWPPEPEAASETPETGDRLLEQLQAELEQERDAHLLALADLRNYRQRMTRDQAEQARYQAGQVLQALIPTLDHLEMALKAAEEHGEGGTALAEGVYLTYRQLVETLEQFGLRALPAQGALFDPTRHEAVDREEVELGGPPEGTVVAELRKGWLLHDRVLRPAQVRVAVPRL